MKDVFIVIDVYRVEYLKKSLICACAHKPINRNNISIFFIVLILSVNIQNYNYVNVNVTDLV